MRRALLMLMAAAWLAACSHDAELPVNYHDDLLAQPESTAALGEGTIEVSWEMASLDNVEGFVVGFIDTSGAETTRALPDPQATSLVEADVDLGSGSIWVVRVWAYDAVGFFGPTSMPDTLRVE
jgi:CO/xanthine dehydrogenase Mo-binding subunit